MSAIYRFFRSVRLAVVLLLSITVLSILSTLIPQSQPSDYYRGIYPEGLATLILGLRFDRFFSSALFLSPVALFLANLGTCTVHRLATRARSGAPRRHGPDLVHIALLVLGIGGITTTLVRRERYFTMGVGDAVEITGGYRVELLDFDFRKYDTGRPQEWISTVRVQRNGKTVTDGYGIEVNRPLRLGLLRVYQTSYDTDGFVRVTDPHGAAATLARGDGIPSGEAVRYFVALEPGSQGGYRAVFQELRGQERGAVLRVAAGESMGGYRIEGIDARELTGLTAARDPGYILVLTALILGTAGMTLTFLQRKGESTP